MPSLIFLVFVIEQGNAVGSRRDLNHRVGLPPGFSPRLLSRKCSKQAGRSVSTRAESRQPPPSINHCASFTHLCGYAMYLSRFQELIQSQVDLLPLPISSVRGNPQPKLPAFLNLQTQICRYWFQGPHASKSLQTPNLVLTQRLSTAWNLSRFVLMPV